jgi:hypothetical protein
MQPNESPLQRSTRTFDVAAPYIRDELGQRTSSASE